MRFIVIGCGRVGAGLATLLDGRGHDVCVIDVDPEAFARLAPGFRGRTIAGVGVDRDVLIEAGIERSDGLAAVTGSDETNVVVARLARERFSVPRVVARVYDPRKARFYQRLGVPTITPVTWGIHRIAELLQYSWLDVGYTLGGGDVDILEVEVPALLVGRTIAELTVPGEVSVAAITRGTRTFLPTPATALQAGDRVHLVALATAAARVDALLGHR